MSVHAWSDWHSYQRERVCVCVCEEERMRPGPKFVIDDIMGTERQTYHSHMEVTTKLSHTQSKLTVLIIFTALYCINHKERQILI